jgi:hypothetical protein
MLIFLLSFSSLLILSLIFDLGTEYETHRLRSEFMTLAGFCKDSPL